MEPAQSLLRMQHFGNLSQYMGQFMDSRHKIMNYRAFPIFRDISGASIQRMLDCFHVRQAEYAPGSVVREYGGGRRDVGIVTEGTADLVRIDYGGTRTILEHLEAGGIFGEALAFTAQTGDSVSVVTETGCRVMYMDYAHIMKRCENACLHHSQLVQNLFALVTDQMQQMGRRVEVLSRRSIREKLSAYFLLLSIKNRSKRFQLPFSYSFLADYICTDRSAMMRELRNMKEERLLQTQGREILLYPAFFQLTGCRIVKDIGQRTH